MDDRPDLDEFLSALNGFIETKETPVPQDPSYLRFLEIFCRSVGSAEGHLLHFVEGKGLETIVSSGLRDKFIAEFHKTALSPGHESSPLDTAYRDQQVVALVELKRGAGVPMWFMDLMSDHKLKSLVAVPLIGQSRAVGVLCAYYRDVCLFDQGTLDRLMTIGRMVGTAMEKSIQAGSEVIDRSDPIIDTYLKILTTQPLGKNHVFEALTKILAKTLNPTGIVVGSLRVSGSGLTMTISDGVGISPALMSRPFNVPPFLAQKIMLGQSNRVAGGSHVEDWGDFRQLVTSKSATALCQPIVWHKQSQSAIFAWRSEKKPFTESDESLLARLSSITALALHAI